MELYCVELLPDALRLFHRRLGVCFRHIVILIEEVLIPQSIGKVDIRYRVRNFPCRERRKSALHFDAEYLEVDRPGRASKFKKRLFDVRECFCIFRDRYQSRYPRLVKPLSEIAPDIRRYLHKRIAIVWHPDKVCRSVRLRHLEKRSESDIPLIEPLVPFRIESEHDIVPVPALRRREDHL